MLFFQQETEEEEKTPLEDVFKFDSELAKDEMDEDEDEDNKEDDIENENKKMSVSLDDLKDALNDDSVTTDDSESDFKECSSGGYGTNGDELRCGMNDRGRMRGGMSEINRILHWNSP